MENRAWQFQSWRQRLPVGMRKTWESRVTFRTRTRRGADLSSVSRTLGLTRQVVKISQPAIARRARHFANGKTRPATIATCSRLRLRSLASAVPRSLGRCMARTGRHRLVGRVTIRPRPLLYVRTSVPLARCPRRSRRVNGDGRRAQNGFPRAFCVSTEVHRSSCGPYWRHVWR